MTADTFGLKSRGSEPQATSLQTKKSFKDANQPNSNLIDLGLDLLDAFVTFELHDRREHDVDRRRHFRRTSGESVVESDATKRLPVVVLSTT